MPTDYIPPLRVFDGSAPHGLHRSGRPFGAARSCPGADPVGAL